MRAANVTPKPNVCLLHPALQTRPLSPQRVPDPVNTALVTTNVTCGDQPSSSCLEKCWRRGAEPRAGTSDRERGAHLHEGAQPRRLRPGPWCVSPRLTTKQTGRLRRAPPPAPPPRQPRASRGRALPTACCCCHDSGSEGQVLQPVTEPAPGRARRVRQGLTERRAATRVTRAHADRRTPHVALQPHEPHPGPGRSRPGGPTDLAAVLLLYRALPWVGTCCHVMTRS